MKLFVLFFPSLCLLKSLYQQSVMVVVLFCPIFISLLLFIVPLIQFPFPSCWFSHTLYTVFSLLSCNPSSITTYDYQVVLQGGNVTLQPLQLIWFLHMRVWFLNWIYANALIIYAYFPFPVPCRPVSAIPLTQWPFAGLHGAPWLTWMLLSTVCSC